MGAPERGEPVSRTSRTAELENTGCRLRAHEHPRLGRVLEAVLSGRQDPEFWDQLRSVLRNEVAGRAPQYLVLDLRALDSLVGSALLGGLVAGALEMERNGKPGRTRIIATGEIAGRLNVVVPLCKLEPVLGGVYPDLESAFAETGPIAASPPR